MKFKHCFLRLMLIACTLILYSASLVYSLPAFPGAKGHGSETKGGRGGKVLFVTNLNDDGDGSFRKAVTTSGARIVVFRVGGTIKLNGTISVQKPNLTIAGQTAPGDGICIRNAHMNIATSDVIVRGLRFRTGDDKNGPNPDNRDGLNVAHSTNNPHNIIIDHCSVSWAIDENMSTWYDCHDITIQWCIISEALSNSLHSKGEHSKGLLIGDESKKVTVHHNLFAHNYRRNPLMKGGTTVHVVNNVIYNWGGAGIHFSDYEDINIAIEGNFIANYFKKGKDTNRKEFDIPSHMPPNSKIYIKDNIGPNRTSSSTDDWNMVQGSNSFRVNSPIQSLVSVQHQPVDEVMDTVLAHAGAIAPERDVVDKRIVKSVKDGTGEIIDKVSEVGGHPAYKGGTAPADSDNDGMPDAWESARGLNKNSDDSKGDDDGDGYTNIEEYINELLMPESATYAGKAAFSYRRNRKATALSSEPVYDMKGRKITQEIKSKKLPNGIGKVKR